MQQRTLRNGTEINIAYHLNMLFECLYQRFRDKKIAEGNESPSAMEFVATYYDLLREKITTGDEFVSQALTINKTLGEEAIYVTSILYSREARNAYEDGNINLAWSYLCDALYFAGFNNGAIGALSPSYLDRKVDVAADLFLVEQQLQDVIKSQNGKEGGDSTSEQFRIKVVEPIFSLLKELKPPVKGWPSMKNAAETLQDHIQKMDEKGESAPLSVDRTWRSIYDVIRDNRDRFKQINQKPTATPLSGK